MVEADDDDLQNGHTPMDVFRVSSMEIDPHKMGDAADATINSLELWLVAQKLYKCIVDSEKMMPIQIKQLMRHIDAEVGAKFGPSAQQAQFRAIGGFLFLRMVCPALMAPQVFGLLDGPPHPVPSHTRPHPPSFFSLPSFFLRFRFLWPLTIFVLSSNRWRRGS